MIQMINYIVNGIIATLLLIIMLQFYLEKEFYAIKQTLKLIMVYLAIVLGLIFLQVNLLYLTIPVVVFGIALLLILFIPYKFPSVQLKLFEERIDERTIIFSRMFELNNNTEKKQAFYAEFPQFEKIDEKLRDLPGLLSKDALYFNREYFNKAKEYDKKLSQLFYLIKGVPNHVVSELPIAEIENKIEAQAKKAGAVSIGFTELNDDHFYSIKGRGYQYGNDIKSEHKYAIAFTVEMDKEAVDKAPKAPVIAESVKQYYRSANIATSIAKYLRELGYSATAHIDANYEVICPLVARDAGLGDIGRMGLLMTPELGPRVRISVVTTTLELNPSKKIYRNSLQYFCRICKKCAHACPSKAIQEKDMVEVEQVRYKINHEKCYGYWAKVGTDCARCMSVCPYSHPNNWFHNIIRFGINQNPLFARLALIADHYFYGKIPTIKK